VKLAKILVTAALIATISQTASAAQAGDYQLYEVGREQIALTLSFAGTVSADKTLQLTAQMPGRIADIAGKEGDAFEEDSILVELDDSGLLARLEAAIANRDAAVADMRNARVQLDREIFSPRSNSAGAAPGGMGMPAMMDQMFTNPMQNMMGMRSRGTELRSDLVGAETALAQATTRMKSAEANIREIQSLLRDTQGIAPFAGVIQKVHVEIGDTVQPGQVLEVALQGSNLLQAPVSLVHPVADPRQNTVRVELTLPDDSGATPGQYVEIRVPDNTANLPAQLTIPKSAVVTKGGLPLVYAVGPDGQARLRVVRLGNAPDPQSRIVLSGVNEGDLLVDNPPPGLRSGTRIIEPVEPETAQNQQ